MARINVKESLCFRMLRCLDVKRQEGLAVYLNCSLFNTNANLTKVFHLLRASASPAQPAILSPEELFADTDINPKLFPKYAAQLVSHMERFVPFWEQRADPRHGLADAFTAWEKLGLSQELLERQYRKMKRTAAKLPPSEWGLFQAFELEHRYLQYKAGLPRKNQAALFEAAEHALDDLYLATKIRYECARRSLDSFFSDAGTHQPLDLAALDFDRLPLLGKAYFRLAMLLKADQLTPDVAREFHLWLRTQQHQFSIADREDLFGILLNLCIQNQARAPQFTLLLDEVYMDMVLEKLLHNKPHLAGSHFKNIVSIKLKLNELEAATRFIAQHQQELSAEDRKVLAPYTRGLVAYHQGQFREAVMHFRHVVEAQPTDVYWGLEARLMLWRSYYEILDVMEAHEHAEFLRQYDATRIYLSRRNHLNRQQRVGAENFIRIFNRLSRLREAPASRKELEALKVEVLDLEIIKQRAWLCQIIDRALMQLR